jgi:hypothetical protein
MEATLRPPDHDTAFTERKGESAVSVFTVVRNIFAAIGVVLAAGLGAGFALDVAAFDNTRGGYDPPYTNYTGEPIDWSVMDVTPTGMASRGHVINVLVDCTTGMMHFETFGVAIPFREFSPRALAVHQPREACMERGFTPAF